MLFATDVHYRSDHAKAIGLTFSDWSTDQTQQWFETIITEVAPYQPGSFYQRELPCLLQLLEQLDIHTLNAIIIDGYVQLDNSGRPGLGLHLYEALDRAVPIIGVAKSAFRNNTLHVRPVRRGAGSKPL